MTFLVGEAVEWRSSNTSKTGVVVAVVPARTMPKDVGFPKVGKESSPRDQESYVVEGGVPGSRTKDQFWPVVSLLRKAGGLSSREMAWCNAHADEVRAFIATKGGA